MDGADALQFVLVNNIEGDLVECGVEIGNFEMIWIHALMKHGQQRNIWPGCLTRSRVSQDRAIHALKVSTL